ncbi:MAG: diguanylate cyclase [Geminicoccaceae bacterium]
MRRRWWPLSFRWRIALTILCLELGMVALVLMVTLRHSYETARAELAAADRQAVAMFRDLARLALVDDELGNIQAYFEETQARGRLRQADLIDLSGRVLASSDPRRIGTFLVESEALDDGRDELIEIGSGGYRAGWLALDFSDEPLLAAYRQSTRLGIAVAAVSMAVIAIVAFSLSHLLTRRLERLAAMADAVNEGSPGQRLHLAGDDEVARVARAFDGMLDRLARHLESVRVDRDRMVLPTEVIHEGFALWDRADRLVRCNARLRELLGPSGALLVPGVSFRRFVRLEAAQIQVPAGGRLGSWVRERITQHREGAAGLEHGYRGGRWAQVSESRMPDGSTISIYVDVTEARQREQQLRESERRLRAIMASAQDAIIVLDDAWRVEAANPAARSLFGLQGPAGERPTFDELLWPSDEAAPGTRRRPPPGPGTIELVGRRGDGSRFAAEVSLSALGEQAHGGYLATVRDITRAKADREQILFHATHDHLTGLPNRRLFDDRLTSALRNAARRGEMLAVALLDLDRFKAVNDSLGHAAGDELLTALAQRFTATLRASDTVARLGGDEFIFVFAGIDTAQDARFPTDKLLEAAALPVRLGEREVSISASIGVSLFPEDGLEAQTLLRRADAALYAAKARGRGCCVLYDGVMPADPAARVPKPVRPREAALRARERRELRLLYQPQTDLRTGRLVGLQALVHWRQPRHGPLGPDQLAHAGTDPLLLASFGSWMLRRACRDLADRLALPATGPLRVSVGLPSPRLPPGELAGLIERLLAETGLAPERLEIELPEAAFLDEDPAAARSLQRLHGRGVGLALEHGQAAGDTGALLRRLPFTRLKLSAALLQGLAATPGSPEEATAELVALAAGLGLRVLAAGIELPEQLALARRLGCHEVQGGLLGQPVRGGELGPLLARAA